MDIQKKIDTQKEKIKKLKAEVKQNKDAKQKIASALSQCMDKLGAYSDAHKAKKRGIIWLVVAGILAITEIVLLMGIVPGNEDFQVIDLVIIGIPLFFGIKNLKAQIPQYQESVEDLTAQRQKLQEELARFDDTLEQQLQTAQNDLNNITRYTGREWDISTFYATPENVAAMEKDFENLLVALKYSNSSDFKINCWLSANEIKRSTAEFGNQKSTVAAYARGTTAIKNAGSWKLEVALIAMGVISFALLNVALYNGQGSSATFEELLGKSNVRKPVNEDEKALLALTSEVISDLAFEVKYSLMKMRS